MRLTLRGTSRFCPDCGRILVAIDDEGNAQILGDVHVISNLKRGDYVENEEGILCAETYSFDAICLACHPDPQAPVVERRAPQPSRDRWEEGVVIGGIWVFAMLNGIALGYLAYRIVRGLLG